MTNQEKHVQNQHVDQLYITAIQVHSGAQIIPNFSRRESSNMIFQRALPFRACGVRDSHQTRRAVPSGFEGHQGRQAEYLTLVKPTDKNPDNKYLGYKHWKPHHDAIYVVDMEGARVLPNGCVTCFNTISKEYIKRVVNINDKNRDVSQDSGRSSTRTVKKGRHLQRLSEKISCYRKRYAQSNNNFHEQGGNLLRTKWSWPPEQKEL